MEGDRQTRFLLYFVSGNITERQTKPQVRGLGPQPEPVSKVMVPIPYTI